jgi:hypothetical protein
LGNLPPAGHFNRQKTIEQSNVFPSVAFAENLTSQRRPRGRKSRPYGSLFFGFCFNIAIKIL